MMLHRLHFIFHSTLPLIYHMSNPELILEQYTKIIDGHSTESIKEGEQTLLRLERCASFVADNAAILY